MIVKNIYTLSIKDWILFENTGNYKYLFTIRIELLKSVFKSQINDFLLSVSELFGSKEIENFIHDSNYKLYLIKTIVLLRRLETAVLLDLQYRNVVKDENGLKALELSALSDEWEDVFKQYCKAKYSSDDKSAVKLAKKILFFESKLNEEASKPKDEKEGTKISSIIPMIDNVDLNAPLFMLKQYLDAQIKKNSNG